jgi:hypothetical protein
MRFAMRPIAALLAVLTLSLPVGSMAQDARPLVTDRPDFTESAILVPTGSLQIETGATFTRRNGSWNGTGPEALVRWAPDGSVELRLTLPNYVSDGRADGFSDAGAGLKVPVGAVAGWTLAAIASITVPTGEQGLSADRLVPGVILTGGRSLDSGWSLGSQAGATWYGAVDDPEWLGTVVVSRGLTDRLGAFAEILVSGGAGAPATVLLHHGYTWAAGPLAQLDLHFGLGLTDASADFLVGAGWSHRF